MNFKGIKLGIVLFGLVLGLGMGTNVNAETDNNEWLSVGPEGGWIRTLVIDPFTPSILYAGAFQGGIFKSTNSGESWQAINTGLTNNQVLTITIDPLNPSTLFAGTFFHGIFKSTNSGESWQAINTGLNNNYIHSIAIDPLNPSTLYASTYPNGVFKSINSGDSWQAINSGLTNALIETITIDPLTPSILYAGSQYYGVFKSTDSGESWQAINTGLPGTSVQTIAIDPLTPSILYVNNQSGIFKSTNSGESWQAANMGLPIYASVQTIAIDPLNPSILYVGNSYYGIFKSINSGDSWQAINSGLTNTRVETIVINPLAPSILYAGNSYDGIFKSTNSGENWQAINTGLTNALIETIAIDPLTPSTLFAGTFFHGIFKSTNSGESWQAINTGLPHLYALIQIIAIDPLNPSTLYAGTSGNGIFKSTNSGESWRAINMGLTNNQVLTIAIDPLNPSTLYAGTYNSVFKSTNSGESWQAINTGLPNTGLPNTRVETIAIDPLNPSTLYAGTYNSVFKSTNSGESWQAVNIGLTGIWVKTIVIDPLNPSTLYAGTHDGVFKSTNSGASWQAVNTGLTNTQVLTIVIDPLTPSTLFAGTYGGGVFKTTNSGESWQAVNIGLTNIYIRTLVTNSFTPSTLFAGTYGGGVFKYNGDSENLQQCSDGFDNDGDGLVDMDDPGCESAEDDDEYNIITVPTIIHDDIIVDTYWTIEHSPYLIQKDIFVKEGAILTIEPGVIVKFGSIDGTEVSSGGLILRDDSSLVARGTPSSLIYFTDYRNDEMGGDTNNDGDEIVLPLDGTGSYPYWYAAIANQGSGLLSLQYVHTKFIRSIQQDDLSKSGTGRLEIRNSLIEQCSTAAFINGNGALATALLDKVEIRGCATGVRATGEAAVDVTNSLFYNLSTAAMAIQPYLEDLAPTTNVTITGSIFEGENEYALFSHDGIEDDINNSVIDVRNNWWDDSSGPMHISNPGGKGQEIFYHGLADVLFTPWLTTRPTINIWEEDSPQCSDGEDNDKDGYVDYPEDPGCESINDDSEKSLNSFSMQKRIALGDGSSCMLHSNGYVYCWGSNMFGQIGNGVIDNRMTPAIVSGVSNVVEISSAGDSMCALIENGTVMCWGGELGEGSYPHLVSGVNNAVQISHGDKHSCILDSSHKVLCWGDNTYGQLGNGSTVTSLNPVYVVGIENAVSVSVGLHHTCAILANGELKCWGWNNYGQLADGTLNGSEVPVTAIGGVESIDVTTGYNTTCVVLKSGLLKCWGQYMSNSCDLTQPTTIAGITNAIAVDGRKWNVCVLSESGEIMCFGNNNEGQLGNGVINVSYDLNPVLVKNLTDITEVAVGGAHACAVASDNQVECWGSNVFGELGDGSEHQRLIPVKVIGLTGGLECADGKDNDNDGLIDEQDPGCLIDDPAYPLQREIDDQVKEFLSDYDNKIEKTIAEYDNTFKPLASDLIETHSALREDVIESFYSIVIETLMLAVKIDGLSKDELEGIKTGATLSDGQYGKIMGFLGGVEDVDLKEDLINELISIQNKELTDELALKVAQGVLRAAIAQGFLESIDKIIKPDNVERLLELMEDLLWENAEDVEMRVKQQLDSHRIALRESVRELEFIVNTNTYTPQQLVEYGNNFSERKTAAILMGTYYQAFSSTPINYEEMSDIDRSASARWIADLSLTLSSAILEKVYPWTTGLFVIVDVLGVATDVKIMTDQFAMAIRARGTLEMLLSDDENIDAFPQDIDGLIKNNMYEGVDAMEEESLPQDIDGSITVTKLGKDYVKYRVKNIGHVPTWYKVLADSTTHIVTSAIIFGIQTDYYIQDAFTDPEDEWKFLEPGEVWEEEVNIEYSKTSNVIFFSLLARVDNSLFGVDTDSIAGEGEIKTFGGVVGILLGSPGELRVYDAMGNITGLINGIVHEEIPLSDYMEDEHAVMIVGNKEDYRYEIYGTDTGTYSLRLLSTGDGENGLVSINQIEQHVQGDAIPLSPNVTHSYTVSSDIDDSNETVILTIDVNSDGVIESEVLVGDVIDDITAPTTTLSLHGDTAGQIFYSDVQIVVNSFDGVFGVGVEKIEYSYDNETWLKYTGATTISEEGEYTIYYRSADWFGNIEKTRSVSFEIVSAYSLLQTVQTNLEKLDQTNPIKQTLKQLEQALNDKYWQDNNTLTKKSGESVFAHLKNAIRHLEYSEDLENIKSDIEVAMEILSMFNENNVSSGSSGNIISGGGGGVFITLPTNTSIIVNNGESNTVDKNVVLTLSASNVAQMAISNSVDFTNISWEDYEISKEWSLTSGVGEKTVYAKFRSLTGGISATVSDAITFLRGSVLGVTTTNIVDGDIIQCQSSENPFAVYIIKEVGDVKYIRHIVSLEVFNYYGHLKWENLKQVDSLDSYSLSGWIRVNTGLNGTSDPNNKVYEINGDQTKHWINMNAEEFLTHGGSDTAIYSVNQGELDLYDTGPDVIML